MARTSKYAGLEGTFAQQLQIFRIEALEAIDQTIRDVVIQVGETIINLSPVDTGRFKGNWQFTVSQPSNFSLAAYDKTGQETIAALVAQVNAMDPKQVLWLVNNLVYAIPLEYGHSQQAPVGVVRITLARFQSIVDDVIRINQI